MWARPRSRQHAALKIGLDRLGAVLLIVLLLPLLIGTALAVKIGDGGPVFFRQTRVGRDGHLFRMTKFRSMVPDAERRLAEVADQNEADAVLFKMRRDPRVTRVGRFIRRLSLDELPQLFDVLRGDMSLVGPRPALPHEVAQYSADAFRRLSVRPGITGMWQISGRSDLAYDEALRLDLWYVDHWSLVRDLKILGRTAHVVLLARGAY